MAYKNIISVENLLLAWQEFIKGKRNRIDVQEFQLHLMDNILSLHKDLKNKTYRHGGYEHFKISDPKPRDIHKASVRDRLVHHAIYRVLYSHFDKTFINDSYSCRLNKGTHKAINRFRSFAYKASQNHTRTVWTLKCDIKKFFASIDHQVLISLLQRVIAFSDVLWLLQEVIKSFNSKSGKGLPLGNLTSQLLVNIYMNEFDQFIKHKLKTKYYIRYADDFVVFSHNRDWLENLIPQIQLFLNKNLKLELHPNKVSTETLASGVDFLGWVHFLDHRVLRTSTRRRMMRRIEESPAPETINSYLGLIKYGDTFKIQRVIIIQRFPINQLTI